MKIKTLFVPLKNVAPITPIGLSKATNNSWNTMTAYQAKKLCGLYFKEYDLTETYEKAEEFYTPLHNRFLKLAKKEYPDYVHKSPIYSPTWKCIDRELFALRLAIKGLFKAYATKNWEWVSIHSVEINTHYLGAYRAIYGNNVDYYNSKDVASDYNFIAPKERTLFGKRKKQGSK